MPFPIPLFLTLKLHPSHFSSLLILFYFSSLSTDGCDDDDGDVLGSAVARHLSASDPQVLQHSIELGVTVQSRQLSIDCRERYRLKLADNLTDMSRLINEMICNNSMCPYLAGAPGTGVRVNESSILSKHVVFAAIDTASLSNPVSFDDVTSTVCHKNWSHTFSFYTCSRLSWIDGNGKAEHLYSALHGIQTTLKCSDKDHTV